MCYLKIITCNPLIFIVSHPKLLYQKKWNNSLLNIIIKSMRGSRLAPVSNVSFFSKTDTLSKIAIYKLYLEVEILGLDIRLNLTISEDRIFRR